MHTAEKAYLKMLECAEIVGMETVEDLFQRGFPKTGWAYTWQNIFDFYAEMLTYLTEL